jgi:tRNA-specific 2-thiouridylase
MFRPVDQDRDQSYFLYATTQDQLDFLRFPLGSQSKAETRQLARDYGIGIADKPDSQDICFVPQGRYNAIVEKLRPDAVRPGKIVHRDGRVLGAHEGVHNFTIGQRRGLGLATGEPLYVIRLDAQNNAVIVGPREALGAFRMRLRAFNWIGDTPVEHWPDNGLDVSVRVRSTRKPCPAILRRDEDGFSVDIIDGEEGIAPGQACVIYENGDTQARVLGGGTIAQVVHEQVRPVGTGDVTRSDDRLRL